MMKDVTNILNTLLKDFESDDSLESLVYAVRNLNDFINSHECLQTCIKELFEAKIQDQKHFENIAKAVVKDVHQAASDLERKIDRLPCLKTTINPTFFAEIKDKVRLCEYPVEERPLLLIEPLVKLLNVILECRGTEHLITPYATIASNNDRKFIREITFSDNIRTFCREAEHFRGRRDMALWNLWEKIGFFYELTKNGITHLASKEKLGTFASKNKIRLAFKTICLHLLANSFKTQTNEVNVSSSMMNENLSALSHKLETFIIKALEIFIEPFECQIWILSHHNNGEYHPYFVAWRKDGSRAHEFAIDLLSCNKGDVLVDEDLPARRNDLGIKGILKDIFFQNSNIFNGRYVRLDELPFKISNEQLLADLPKAKQRTPKFPIDAYNKYLRSRS